MVGIWCGTYQCLVGVKSVDGGVEEFSDYLFVDLFGDVVVGFALEVEEGNCVAPVEDN